MKRNSFLLLGGLIMLAMIAACSSVPKTPEVVEPPRNPIELAKEAAGNGMDNYEAGSYNEAITAFEQAIALFEEAAPTAGELDSIAVNIERMKLNIATSRNSQAEESFQDQIFVEAIQHYEQALEIYNALEPVTITSEELEANKIRLYNNLAITNQRAGSFEESVRYYDMILAKEPNNAEVLNFKFNVLNNDIRDEQRAFQSLKDYADASNDVNAFIMLAGKYADKGNNEQATLYYERALSSRPDANTYKALANFYRQTTQWAKSNEILLRFVATTPEQSEMLIAYRLIGDNYSKLNNRAKMAEYFEKALAIEEDSQIALALASYYNGSSNWNKVVSFATMALRGAPRNADALLLRGNAYYRLNRFNEARTDLELIRNDARHGANATALLNAIANRRP